jgi:uncharacterized protein YdhG (YjbR/CyaY superfamily)
MSATTTAVDEYISTFPPDVAAQLEAVRQAIRQAAPDAEERISYGIPTFTLGGRYLVYFAGWKHHISLYPVPDDDRLNEELVPYRSGKGTLRFPLAEPMPLELVQRVAEALVSREVGETP